MTRRNFYNVVFIMLPLLLLSNVCVAQQSNGDMESRKKEELVQQRKTFYAQELGLTAEEADFLDRTLRVADKKSIPLWRELRGLYEETKSGSLSEEQAARCIERQQQLKAQLAEINEQALTELRKQIPARKLLTYQQVRRDFARKFVKECQRNRSERGG